MLSEKAEKLLAVIREKGGGTFDEYLLRDKTGLSHGSIVAGRRELEMAGLLQLTKQGRKLYYTLTSQENAPLTGQVTVDGQPPAVSQMSTVNPAATSSPAGGGPVPATLLAVTLTPAVSILP